MDSRISLTDKIYALLRQEILSGVLQSGSMHSIYEVARRLDVSRTPVRDAVLRLANANMVSIERNRGFRVRGVSVADVQEVFEARLLLEVPAASHAATHCSRDLQVSLDESKGLMFEAVARGGVVEFTTLDREFHRKIMLATGNEKIADMVEVLRDATQSQGVSTVGASRSIEDIHREHLPIIDAICTRDADGAGRLMHEHLVSTALLLMRQVAASHGQERPSGWPSLLAP